MLQKGRSPRVKIFSKSFQIKNCEKLINCYGRADNSKLGQGGFGQIFRIVDKKSSKQDAFKCLKKVSQGDRTQAISEINALKSLSHPNILKFYEYFESETSLFIVIEYVDGVDLIDFIQSGDTISEKTAATIMRQLLQALAYTHEKQFVHRDIKCENIMITKLKDRKTPRDSIEQSNELKSNNKQDISAPEQSDIPQTPVKQTDQETQNNNEHTEKHEETSNKENSAERSNSNKEHNHEQQKQPESENIEVKLIDWGFAYNLGLQKKEFIESKQLLGTYSYISPEQIKLEPYNEKCDIWSAGVVMYCILTKCFPFSSDLKFSERLLHYQQGQQASSSQSSHQSDIEHSSETEKSGQTHEGSHETKVDQQKQQQSQKQEIPISLLEAKKRFKKEQQQDLFNIILHSEPKYDESVQSPEAIDLLKKMLTKNQSARATAIECLNHPWFNKSESHYVDLEKVKTNLKKMTKFTYQNEFQLAVWTYISSHLVENREKKELEEIFKRIDKDNNGVLSKEEIKQALEESELAADDNDVDSLFEAIDTDKSGFIDYSEFLASTIDQNLLAEKEHMQRVFSLIDLDKNGTISLIELKNILGSHDQRMKPEFQSIFEDIFAQIDVNHDGEISFEEFEHLILSSGETETLNAQ